MKVLTKRTAAAVTAFVLAFTPAFPATLAFGDEPTQPSPAGVPMRETPVPSAPPQPAPQPVPSTIALGPTTYQNISDAVSDRHSTPELVDAIKQSIRRNPPTDADRQLCARQPNCLAMSVRFQDNAGLRYTAQLKGATTGMERGPDGKMYVRYDVVPGSLSREQPRPTPQPEPVPSPAPEPEPQPSPAPEQATRVGQCGVSVFVNGNVSYSCNAFSGVDTALWEPITVLTNNLGAVDRLMSRIAEKMGIRPDQIVELYGVSRQDRRLRPNAFDSYLVVTSVLPPGSQPAPTPQPATQREKPVAFIKREWDCPSPGSGIMRACMESAFLVDSEGNPIDPANVGIPINLTDGGIIGDRMIGSRRPQFNEVMCAWKALNSDQVYLSRNGQWMWRGQERQVRPRNGARRLIRDPDVPLAGRDSFMEATLQRITSQGRLKPWNELFPGFVVTELARPNDRSAQLLLSFIPKNQPPASRVRPVPSRRFINYAVNHRPGRPSGVFTASNQDELVRELRRVVHPRLTLRKQLPPGKHALIVASDGSSDSGLPVRNIVVKEIQSQQDSDGNVTWVVTVERRLDAKRTYRRRPMPVAVVTVDEIPPPTARIEVRYTERTI